MRSKLWLGLLGVLAACALAACGSSSSSSSASGSGSSGTASTGSASSASNGSATKSPIVIGLVSPGAGSPVFSYQPQVSADQAFINTVNKQGGFNGHPLKLDYCNDKQDPNLTISCARQMSTDHAVMIAGADDLNGAQLANVLNKEGIPEVGINAISGGELNSPNVFLTTTTIPGYIVVVGYLAAHHIPTAMAGTDNTTARQLYASVNAAGASVHHPYISQTLVPANAADFSPYVVATVRNHPKAIMDFFGLQQEEQFFSKLTQVGSTATPYTAYGYSSPSQAKLVGGPAALDRIVSFGSFLPLQTTSNPLIKEFNQELKVQAATGDSNADLSQQDGDTFSGWLALWTLQQFVKNGTVNANNITAASVMHAFKTAKNINMDGVMPPWTPNAPGPKGLSRVSNPYYYMWGYSDGGAKTHLLFPKPVDDAQALAGQFK
jgi:branched-chain amino acid transport system substrate-binding protein